MPAEFATEVTTLGAPVGASAGDSGVPGSGRLSGTLGTFDIVLMVVAAAAPLSVTAATIPLMFLVTGSTGVPAYMAVCTLILLVFSVGFTRMSAYIRNAGAFYSYVQAGLGRVLGNGTAFLAIGAYFLLLLAVYFLFGIMTADLFGAFFGLSVHWAVPTAVCLVATAVLGYLNIDLSAKVLGVFLVLETLVVAVLDVVIIVRGGAEGLSLVSSLGIGDPASSWGLGLMYAVLGFMGFEATAVFRKETKDPDTTIPRATFLAVVFIGVFYTLSAWCMSMGVGPGGIVDAATEDYEGVILTLGATYVAPVFNSIMQVLIITSLFACILAFHNVTARYLFSLGGTGALPRRLGRPHAAFGTPSFASAVVSTGSVAVVGAYLLFGLDPLTVGYTWLSGTATLGLLALIALTSLAVIVFFALRTQDRNPWGTRIAPGLALLGMAVILTVVIANFVDLVGDPVAAVVLPVLLAVLLGAGMVSALVMKARRPAEYAALLDQ